MKQALLVVLAVMAMFLGAAMPAFAGGLTIPIDSATMVAGVIRNQNVYPIPDVNGRLQVEVDDQIYLAITNTMYPGTTYEGTIWLQTPTRGIFGTSVLFPKIWTAKSVGKCDLYAIVKEGDLESRPLKLTFEVKPKSFVASIATTVTNGKQYLYCYLYNRGAASIWNPRIDLTFNGKEISMVGIRSGSFATAKKTMLEEMLPVKGTAMKWNSVSKTWQQAYEPWKNSFFMDTMTGNSTSILRLELQKPPAAFEVTLFNDSTDQQIMPNADGTFTLEAGTPYRIGVSSPWLHLELNWEVPGELNPLKKTMNGFDACAAGNGTVVVTITNLDTNEKLSRTINVHVNGPIDIGRG